MASPSQVYETWRAAFDEIYARGRAFVLTMHPWIIGRAGRLNMLEQLIEHIRQQPGVEFARAIDVATTFAETAQVKRGGK